jgi:pantothenate kinase-related protein Tda10
MTMSATDVVSKRAHYSPPWADVSIIGIAGSSGSGKSTLSHAIVSKLNLPWVVILSMVTTILLKSRILWLKDAGFFLQNLR